MEIKPERCIQIQSDLVNIANLVSKHDIKLEKLVEDVAVLQQKLKQTLPIAEFRAIQVIQQKHDEQIDKLTEITTSASRQLEHVTTKLDAFLDNFDSRMRTTITSLFFTTLLLLIGAVASLKIFFK